MYTNIAVIILYRQFIEFNAIYVAVAREIKGGRIANGIGEKYYYIMHVFDHTWTGWPRRVHGRGRGEVNVAIYLYSIQEMTQPRSFLSIVSA